MKPGAVALIVTVPKPAPVTCGCTAGSFCPDAMNTLAGTVALVVSVLDNAMVTPPAGAPVARLICSGADWPGPIVKVEGSTICPRRPTLMSAVPLSYPGDAAVIVAEP